MKLRLGAYRKFHGWVVEPWLLPRWMSDRRIEDEKRQGLSTRSLPVRRAEVARAWFHAASLGEFESLVPVIEAWIAEGSEAIVTVLSESAGKAVRRCEAPGVLYAGYSPWEGRWEESLKKAQIDAFVTAKYEAWPELWGSLADKGIPLLIVGAKARRSLKLGAALCGALGVKIPKLTLLSVLEGDAEALRKIFARHPQVRVVLTGEPRWDRVHARARTGSARAKSLIERHSELARPWGILAQVWSEDMEVWRGELGRRNGTLWVVPHQVDLEQVERIEYYLRRAGITVRRTSQAGATADAPIVDLMKDQNSEGGRVGCVLVDEVGVLLELYGAVDWAYVGGGFGVSMHSTIEPAIYGLPLACGPSGEEKFPEIEELKSTKQLTVVRDREELEAWLEGLESDDIRIRDQKTAWRADAEARLGATRRVLDVIRGSC